MQKDREIAQDAMIAELLLQEELRKFQGLTLDSFFLDNTLHSLKYVEVWLPQ